MWKKLLVGLFTLVGAFSVAYAYEYEPLNAALYATSSIGYQSGGNVTGRVNMAPTDVNGTVLTGDHFGMQKGDKVQMSMIGWQLLNKEVYTDYGCNNQANYCTNSESVTGWLSASTQSYTGVSAGVSESDFISGTYLPTQKHVNIDNTKFYSEVNKLNLQISNNRRDHQIVTYRNLTSIHDILTLTSTAYKNWKDHVIAATMIGNTQLARSAYIIDPMTQSFAWDSDNSLIDSSLKLAAKDLTFSGNYSGANSLWDPSINQIYQIYCIDANGQVIFDHQRNAVDGTVYMVRPFIYLNMEQVVLAVSSGTTHAIGKVTEPILTHDYTSIYAATSQDQEMKLRIENDTLTNSTKLYGIKNKAQQNITQVMQNGTIYLDAEALAGKDDENGTYTVSAIIFDENNHFSYYKPLEAADGKKLYEFSTAGMEIGKYRIGIINEAYQENTSAPADSSAISQVYELEIVEPLTELTYTPEHDATSSDLLDVYQASASGDYATSANSMIGSLKTLHGVGNDVVNGVFENGIHYHLIAASDSAHTADIDSFTIPMDSGSEKHALDTDDHPYVQPVLKSGVSYLMPGIYQYRIQALDANGDPYLLDPDDPSITYPIDKNGDAIKNGVTVEKGLISDDITTVVYPGPQMSTWTESKSDNGTTGDTSDDRSFGKSEVTGNTVLAQFVFGDEANLQKFKDDGYTVDSIILKEKGTSTVIDNFYLEVDPNDINHYDLKWNTSKPLLTGKTEFDVYINYKHDGAVVGIVKKEAQSLTIYDDFDFSKMKWQNKKNLPDTLSDVSGSINTSGINTNAIVKDYVPSDTFYVQLSDKTGTALQGATITYSLKQGSTANVIEVAANGKVTIKGVSPQNADVKIQATIKKDGYLETTVYLPVTINHGQSAFSYVDGNGTKLPMTNDVYDPYQENGKNIKYQTNGIIQLHTSGAPSGSTVKYKLKDGSPNDVISVNETTGEVTILNATLPIQKDKAVIVATASDPDGNYADTSIEIAINIDKADQTISFKENPINVINGEGTVTPIINEQDISSSQGGVTVNDTDYYISVDSSIDSSIAWTSDGVNISYEYKESEGKDVPLHVEKPGNRNYNKAEANGILHILGPDENVLAINSPGKIYYGDHFTIRSLQDDSSSTNVSYSFTVDNKTYISEPAVNGNKAEFDALKYSGTNKINIKVTRTADGEATLVKNLSVNVLPKEVKIQIDDKDKSKGEMNPTFTYQDFDSQLVSWNGAKDVIQSGDVKLSTTANANSDAGGYPITGDTAYLNKTYPNYSFTFIDGTLSVKEETIKDDWYHMELKDGNQYTGSWTNQAVNIISDHDDYSNLSLDQSTWAPNKVEVIKEGNNEISFWMKKDNGAITGEKKETIKIDLKAPMIEKVTAKDSRNQIQELISQLTNGFFFRPGTTFEIFTNDTNQELEVSGTSSISYKLYKNEESAPIKQDTITVTKEKASITIEGTTGSYRLCMIVKDQAGNESEEICKEIDLKAIGVDSDGDGIPDLNIDTDGDGIPDLNVTKHPDDKLPYLNIDTTGDGKPDMNIDTDGDGIPNLNTGIVKGWKPDTLVDLDKDGTPDYKTSGNLKGINNIDTDKDGYPDINIDLDLDGLPELNINTDGKLDKPQTNIDGNGDGKADINIDKNNDGIPDENVMEIPEWKPEHNVIKDGKVIYDTMELTYKPIDELEDNGIKVQPSDPNASFLPNFALKVDDITSNIDAGIKDEILKQSGTTDSEVKAVYDVKLLEDNQEVQPNGKIKVKIPVDERIENPKLMMKAKDGTWQVIDAKIENGYYVFETEYLNQVSIIGDQKDKSTTTTKKEPKSEPTPSVKGNYYNSNIGGANTGDDTNMMMYVGSITLSLFIVILYRKKIKLLRKQGYESKK